MDEVAQRMLWWWGASVWVGFYEDETVYINIRCLAGWMVRYKARYERWYTAYSMQRENVD